MLFNSLDFILFFPAVVFLFFVLPHKIRWVLLLIASYFFYMCWEAEYAILIAASTLVGYLSAFWIDSAKTQQRRMFFLLTSIFFNLGVLFVFKYFNFFSENVEALLNQLDIFYASPALKLLLPVGISFYTFQVLSYSLDVYRGEKKPEKHLGIFAVYVSFFPQLVAGPIERSTRLLPQFFEKKKFEYARVRSGLMQMLWGFFKKIVIADRLAIIVDYVYANPTENSGFALAVATFFFAIQVYTDFSAYSDIAIGGAKVMGFELMENFSRPYFSKSITEFWRRWHISLSSWITDYLYTPLVIKWRSLRRSGVALALIVTFVLIGLWHGPDWQWVIFGLLHGIAVSYEMFTMKLRNRIKKQFRSKIFATICTVLTFSFVCFSFVFFRANSIDDAFYIAGHLFYGFTEMKLPLGLNGLNTNSLQVFNVNFPEFMLSMLFIFFVLYLEFRGRLGDQTISELILRRPTWFRWITYNFLILMIVFFGIFSHTEFIYFQF